MTAIDMPAAILELNALAYATPNPCEGSRGHLRETYAWEVDDDYRRAIIGDERVRSLYEFENGQRPTCARIAAMCVRDAENALAQWRAQNAAMNAQIVFQGRVVIATVTREFLECVEFTVPHLETPIQWTRDHFARATNEAWTATNAESQDQA